MYCTFCEPRGACAVALARERRAGARDHARDWTPTDSDLCLSPPSICPRASVWFVLVSHPIHHQTSHLSISPHVTSNTRGTRAPQAQCVPREGGRGGAARAAGGGPARGAGRRARRSAGGMGMGHGRRPSSPASSISLELGMGNSRSRAPAAAPRRNEFRPPPFIHGMHLARPRRVCRSSARSTPGMRAVAASAHHRTPHRLIV